MLEAAFLDAPPAWMPVGIQRACTHLFELTEGDVANLSSAERDDLEEHIKATLSRFLRDRDITIPESRPGVVILALQTSTLRTRNALVRHYGSPERVRVTTVHEALKTRNLGINSLIDFLRQLDEAQARIDADDTFQMAQALDFPWKPDQKGQVEPLETKSMPLACTDEACPSPALLLFEILSGKDAVKRRIYLQRTFANGTPVPTLQEIGVSFGVTRERIRQIEARQTERITALLEAPSNRNLRLAVAHFREAVGLVIGCERVAILANEVFRVPGASQLPDELLRFALVLAGCFERDEKWVFTDSRSHVVATTKVAIARYATGTHTESEAVTQAADDCGAPIAFVSECLPELEVEVVAGRVFRRFSNIPDRIEAAFQVLGEPMGADEVVEALGLDKSAKASLLNRLIDDDRFYKVDVNRYALAEWELPRYTTISSAIEEAVEDSGGGITLAALSRELPERFGVSATSVQMYANQPPFMVDDYGIVKMRDKSYIPKRRQLPKPFQSRRLFRHRGVWHLRIRVSTDIFRGIGVTTSSIAASLAGVTRGDIVEKHLGDSLVSYRWKQPQPYISSIKSFAETAGAKVGDLIFVGLMHSADMPAFVISEARLRNATGIPLLAAMCGLAETPDDEVLESIAYSIGCDRDSSLAVMREVLITRRDSEALALLPEETARRTSHDPIDDLLAMLQ